MENNTFLEGKIAAPLIRFAIPLMMSLVLQALYGLSLIHISEPTRP